MNEITPISKKSLADHLAEEIRTFIMRNDYKYGDRLPSTTDLAKLFGVGLPTLREAIKRLETLGTIIVKHGSGIYVGRYFNTLFLPNPITTAQPLSKSKLLELIDARLAMEGMIVSLAIDKITDKKLTVMKKLLEDAKKHLYTIDKCGLDYLKFHYEIRKAAKNFILQEIVRVITNLYTDDQIKLINENISCEDDFNLHCELYEALKRKDAERAIELMEMRLKRIRDIIINYFPDDE